MSRLSKWLRSLRPSQAELLFRSFADKLPRNGIFIDAGANVGNVTQWALDYGHQIYAFEPDPSALHELRRKFDNHPGVTIIPKAVGSGARMARFYMRPEHGHSEWSSLNRYDFHQGGSSFEVEVVDIVSFIRDLGRPVTLLKMDIEGAEAECLEAMLGSGLYRSIGLTLVETHDRFSEDIARRLDAVRQRIAEESIQNINLNWI